jgi:hypothetical protein
MVSPELPIRSAWFRLSEKMGMKKSRLGMKYLRKTSASLLGEHPQYNLYDVFPGRFTQASD